ncbi:MAG: alpha-L-fucosidase [Candidatus Omnitrophota bacterium]
MSLQRNISFTDERTRWWREARLGMFIHWGLYSIPARGEWVMYNERVPIKEYEKLRKIFNPTGYNPRSWARLARSAGMKYMVLTTKHCDGFCLFDSKLTDYTSMYTPARRDLVREYVDACRYEGLRVGFYHSVFDWHHPNYPWHMHSNYTPIDKTFIKPDEKTYYQYLMGQLRELLTNYGKIDVLWFDITYENLDARPLAKMIRTLQPDIMINNRADHDHGDGNYNRLGIMGDFLTPEQFIPKGQMTIDGQPVLWETCNTLTGNVWGYDKYDNNFRAPEEFIKMISLSAGGGGNMLLNVGPRPDGSIQSEAVHILNGIGKWIRKYGESIYGTSAGPACSLPYGIMTAKGHRIYLHVFDWPKNGRLSLPPLKDKPISASVLGGRKLSLSGNNILVPRVAPNKDNSVLVLDYENMDALKPTVSVVTSTGSSVKPIRQMKKISAKRPVDYVVKPGKPVVLDGGIRFQDWKHAKSIRVTDRHNWDEPMGRCAPPKTGECAYTLRMMHAEATLYIAVEIESPSPISKSILWLGDSAEIVMGGNPKENELRHNRESFQILVDVDGNIMTPKESNIPGLVFRHTACRTKKGFNIVLALPFGVLLKDAQRPDSAIQIGDKIDFNIVVNQADVGPGSYWNEYQGTLKKGQPWWTVKPPASPMLRHRVFWKGRGKENRPLTNRREWGRVKIGGTT